MLYCCIVFYSSISLFYIYLLAFGPCVPNPCNKNGASGESCDDGDCKCGLVGCPDGNLCIDGICEGTQVKLKKKSV